MLAILALPVLLFAQAVMAKPSYRDLLDLASILDVEKRLTKEEAEKYIEVCQQEPLELGLVIDSSVSIPVKDFEKGQNFLQDFLSDYDIGQGRNQVRVAAVTFGQGVYIQDSFNLDSFNDKEEVKFHVTHMPFRYGRRTDTGDALKYMREKQMVNTRPWAPKVVIVLTDGNSQRTSYTAEQAMKTIKANITVFALGVGTAVKQQELLNIAGGNEDRVIRAKSYTELDDKVKRKLAYKTCVLKPRPTTPPPQQPCYEKYPSDINFIFSPASMGVDTTSWVTQFISHTINNEELKSGFQYGVVSGDCPDDEGFQLDRYKEVTGIRERLAKYDRNNLPALVDRAATVAFTPGYGARDNAKKVAVIFVGEAKVDQSKLNAAIEKLLDEGVRVFVATTSSKVQVSVPKEVQVLTSGGTSHRQSSELVTYICHGEKTKDDTPDDGGSEDDDC